MSPQATWGEALLWGFVNIQRELNALPPLLRAVRPGDPKKVLGEPTPHRRTRGSVQG
jgi:hypothetical protein